MTYALPADQIVERGGRKFSAETKAEIFPVEVLRCEYELREVQQKFGPWQVETPNGFVDVMPSEPAFVELFASHNGCLDAVKCQCRQ